MRFAMIPFPFSKYSPIIPEKKIKKNIHVVINSKQNTIFFFNLP